MAVGITTTWADILGVGYKIWELVQWISLHMRTKTDVLGL